ncbi:TIGR03751 family conjugal transfer lipoprotein [Pseudomonas sp. HN11]|uniref:TIGR03751 family conjugal transfer lipoprotein n=1 Tax=Pseudomonas sp. HN11 TaxID=1344094 RepID=UPI001F4138EC|nr:TIGR03751 family conjugal transfer lipoprotein [Pseudomonas sp. HN11]UII69685.1 TIGR03751 family conjugal transfer lipoprotein [Pseudomonas sp. HN11]
MKKTTFLCLTWISVFSLVLAGCSTHKDTLLPHGEQTMLDIWNGAGSQGTQQQLLEARQQLRRPLAEVVFSAPIQEPYTRTAANEIRNLFPRLPNPDLVLYVYPHLSGTEQAPIPGYSTVFPFYQRVQYALPGERQEDL